MYRALVSKLDIPHQKIDEILKKGKLFGYYSKILGAYGNEDKLDRRLSVQFYSLGSALNEKIEPYLDDLVLRIKNDDFKTTLQLQEAIKYINKHGKDCDLNSDDFKESCGIGIVITDTQIKKEVAKVIKESAEEIELSANSAAGKILGKVTRGKLRWAPGAAVREEVEKQVRETAKSLNEDPAVPLTGKVISKPRDLENEILEKSKSLKFIFEGDISKLHKPGGNPQIDPELTKQHLKATGGKVVTRFPPEPNGFLHIGHAKAMNINFGYAQAHGGIVYLRYDDTNPEAEEQIYFDSILESLEWLGFEPCKVTYASDYFQDMYELALKLIKSGKAYVCHCSSQKMHEYRGGDNRGPRRECEHRNRSVHENLDEFENMRCGKYEPSEASLRMKMDMQNPNPQFWDLVAYRVLKGTPHMRTGDKWVIYPTYDYAHCLCDSIENITHSLCTVEFEMSRPSYYWLVDALKIYKPVQWEYGRLSIAYTVLSKRRINKLIDEKLISGWDDPRIWSLISLRRRGFTPEAINAAMRDIGVSKALITLNPDKIEHFVRSHLNIIAPRYMMVIDPLKVVIENLPVEYCEPIEVTQPSSVKVDSPKRLVYITRDIYIEKDDFSTAPGPNFLRLSPGKSVSLMNVPNQITCVDVEKNDAGEVTTIIAKYEDSPPTSKVRRTYIHWVSAKDAPKKQIEVRKIDRLFLHPNPNDKVDAPGGWLSDVNPNSLITVKGAVAEPCVYDLKEECKFQAVRQGYFCVDKDSTPENLVLNLTVGLKQSSKK